MVAAAVTQMIRMCFSVYTMLSESCPRMVIVGYGRCFADRPNLMVCLRSMPNVFTGSCARMRCCLSENLLYRHRNGHIQAEWLTDNGSCYRANETRQFARMLGLEPKSTAVRSPESNGIAESFVKTIKRDYISVMPKPDGLTAAKNLAEAFEHYNEWHPHSALGYRSPREYLRQQASNGLSDNRCLEI